MKWMLTHFTHPRILFFACALFLSGCAGSGDEFFFAEEKRTVAQIYNQALDYIDQGDYENASREFDSVERQYPYSLYARRAILMNAYVQYRQGEYDTAISLARRFSSLYPGDDNVAYAHYMEARANYDRIPNVEWDQKVTREAYNNLNDIIQRFPKSAYARDAQMKYHFVRDHLAGRDLGVGLYYLRHKEYGAAIGKFSDVIMRYNTTRQVPEALYRMAEAYGALGIDEEVRAVRNILHDTYPTSRWAFHISRFMERYNIPHEVP